MPDRDYYEILGISREATADQIKKAYRAMARKYHPDVNPGDKDAEAKFKEAQEAYDVLSDEEKRKLYDQFGKAAFEGVGAGPRAGGSEWVYQQAGPGAEYIDFSQFFGPGAGAATMGTGPGASHEASGGIFDELLGRFRAGRTGGRRGPRAGREAETQLTIPFMTAVRGGQTTIEVVRSNGDRETLEVKIPAGTDTGNRLRLRGRGEPGFQGGPPGDLFIRITVEPHPYFQRQGHDLSVEVPLTIAEAALGARVEVPTLEGPRTLPVPAGTSGGQRLRLRGQGVPARGNKPAGDLFVIVKIVTPKQIDEESRRLIQEFADRNPQNPRQGLW